MNWFPLQGWLAAIEFLDRSSKCFRFGHCGECVESCQSAEISPDSPASFSLFEVDAHTMRLYCLSKSMVTSIMKHKLQRAVALSGMIFGLRTLVFCIPSALVHCTAHNCTSTSRLDSHETSLQQCFSSLW